ncbi:MAG: hypothetical protein WC997_03255 [Porticoccaceae bacterium]
MPVLPKNLSPRIAIAVAGYIAISLVVLAVTLNLQLSSLAQNQQTALGNAIGAQLAESLKQPIIDENPISMQVILDNLLNDAEPVVRATVYSTANRILAQSQRYAVPSTQLAPFTSPINVDNTMLGQVRVELDRHLILDRYHAPIWSALALWFLISAGFAFWLMKTGRDYSRRIARLNKSFAAEDGSGAQLSELEQLEKSLAPFTTAASAADATEQPHSYALIAVGIPDLPKWRAQLNAESFSAMLARIDELLDTHLRLFNGVRLQARSNTSLIQFDSDGSEHPAIRTLRCANALLQLGKKLAADEHLPFTMRITLAYRNLNHGGSPWRVDLEREESINRLIDIQPLASAWELVIDKNQLADSDFPGCQLEEFSAAAVWQFRAYDAEQQEDFEGQLAFLSATRA